MAGQATRSVHKPTHLILMGFAGILSGLSLVSLRTLATTGLKRDFSAFLFARGDRSCLRKPMRKKEKV